MGSVPFPDFEDRSQFCEGLFYVFVVKEVAVLFFDFKFVFPECVKSVRRIF